jgi:hypothetical protein
MYVASDRHPGTLCHGLLGVATTWVPPDGSGAVKNETAISNQRCRSPPKPPLICQASKAGSSIKEFVWYSQAAKAARAEAKEMRHLLMYLLGRVR